MKRVMMCILPILIMAMALSPSLMAQDSRYQDPNGVPQFFWYSQTPSDNAAYRGKIDTLPQVPFTGVSQLTFSVVATETVKSTIYFDVKEAGRTTWTSTYTDSIIAAPGVGKDTTIEIPLRSTTLNRLPFGTGYYRARISHHAISPTGTPSDYDSTASYTQKWIWKP